MSERNEMKLILSSFFLLSHMIPVNNHDNPTELPRPLVPNRLMALINPIPCGRDPLSIDCPEPQIKSIPFGPGPLTDSGNNFPNPPVLPIPDVQSKTPPRGYEIPTPQPNRYEIPNPGPQSTAKPPLNRYPSNMPAPEPTPQPNLYLTPKPTTAKPQQRPYGNTNPAPKPTPTIRYTILPEPNGYPIPIPQPIPRQQPNGYHKPQPTQRPTLGPQPNGYQRSNPVPQPNGNSKPVLIATPQSNSNQTPKPAPWPKSNFETTPQSKPQPKPVTIIYIIERYLQTSLPSIAVKQATPGSADQTVPPTQGAVLSVTQKSCQDKSPHCVYWKNKGECESNAFWMKVNCQVSCTSCGETVGTVNKLQNTPGCSNLNNLCQYWKSVNECTKNPVYMKNKCALSCGWCTS